MQNGILFDTSNLIYRMFARAEANRLDPLDTFQEEAEYLMHLFREKYRPIFALDCKRGNTWRNKLLPVYKANRSAPSPELLYYRDKMVEWVKNQYEYYEKEEEEADDIIGTITQILSGKSLIVSNDADYQQLLMNDRVEILCPTRKGTYDRITEETFKETHKLAPIQLIDLKALKGDTSDNYKGCPGIGDKKAKALIDTYKNIEGIYNNIEEIQGKIQKDLKENKDYVYLCKVLATIKQDVDITLHNAKEVIDFGINSLSTDINSTDRPVEAEEPPHITFDAFEIPF